MKKNELSRTKIARACQTRLRAYPKGKLISAGKHGEKGRVRMRRKSSWAQKNIHYPPGKW